MLTTPFISKNDVAVSESKRRCWCECSVTWTPTTWLFCLDIVTDVAINVWMLTATFPAHGVGAAYVLGAFSIINLALIPVHVSEYRHHVENRINEPTPKNRFLACYLLEQLVCDGVMAFSNAGNANTQLVALVYFCFNISWIAIWSCVRRAE
jgi:hypothetical protein